MINSILELVFYVNLNSEKTYSQKIVRILKIVLQNKQITEQSFKPISIDRVNRWINKIEKTIVFIEE